MQRTNACPEDYINLALGGVNQTGQASNTFRSIVDVVTRSNLKPVYRLTANASLTGGERAFD